MLVLIRNWMLLLYWLTYAVGYKQKEMAEFLIENGANVNSNCTNLKTPLHFALMLNHEEFLLILQNGAFFQCQISRQDKSNWRRFNEKTNDCLQNNACLCSILKSKDWINDGIVACLWFLHNTCVRVAIKPSLFNQWSIAFNDFSIGICTML